jgi:hypothetical protein
MKENDRTDKCTDLAAKAKKSREAAIKVRKVANITLVSHLLHQPTRKLSQKISNSPTRSSTLNFSGGLTINRVKQKPPIDLIQEIKDSIVSPNPVFDQLKRDMKTLNRRTKSSEMTTASHLQDGRSMRQTGTVVGKESLATRAGPKGALGGASLEDMAQEASDVFSARKDNAIGGYELFSGGSSEDLWRQMVRFRSIEKGKLLC